MNKVITALLPLVFALLILSNCSGPSGSEVANGSGTPTPEALGISSKDIQSFIETLEKDRPNDVHSFVLMRHGKIAAEGWWSPYDSASTHMLFSLSKSFTSTAIGIAQAEGLLSINDPVISFFPDDTPENPSQNLKSMRIRDLLKMCTGHNNDATDRMRNAGDDWVHNFFTLEVEHKPGTHFVYNSAATFMLSAIIQKVSGKTLLEYLTPRLFEPLHIEGATWETSPTGINSGGWGLKIKTNDIANFGQLLLQKGMWEGKQLVPAAWVEEATSFQTSNGSSPDSDWEQGYGYQFWMCRHGLYRGDGAMGQYCIVFPEQDAVLAMTSGTGDMGAIMNIVWDKLLPAFQEQPLAEDASSYQALNDKINSLSLASSTGEKSSPRAEAVSGKTYVLEDNMEGIKTISYKVNGDQWSMTSTTDAGSVEIPMGYQANIASTFPFSTGAQAVATSAAWTSSDTLTIRMYLKETPFNLTQKVAFSDNGITIVSTRNLGPRQPIIVKGKLN